MSFYTYFIPPFSVVQAEAILLKLCLMTCPIEAAAGGGKVECLESPVSLGTRPELPIRAAAKELVELRCRITPYKSPSGAPPEVYVMWRSRALRVHDWTLRASGSTLTSPTDTTSSWSSWS